jgi:Family of unknown function (DUF5684)
MKVRSSLLSLRALSVVFGVIVLSATGAFAQSMDDAAPFAALSGVMLMFVLGLGFGFYVYLSLALQTIATKTATANAWLAWIPIANLFLLLSIAKKPLWWILLFLIPLVNLIIGIIVWMAVAEARHKPNWWGILLIVPMVNLVVPGYLAWAD